MNVKAIIFDAYGTIFDVHSVTEKCEHYYPGTGKTISEKWRQKQLEYTWLRSLMGQYEDFWNVTKDALLFSLKELRLNVNEKILNDLLKQYLILSPYPEVPLALEKLKTKTNLAILSNGSPDMLNEVIKNAHLDSIFSNIISVDVLKIYKPFMGVYQLGATILEEAKDETLFITANPWDAAGAKNFGFQVCWLNRFNKQFDELNVKPDMVIQNLDELTK